MQNPPKRANFFLSTNYICSHEILYSILFYLFDKLLIFCVQAGVRHSHGAACLQAAQVAGDTPLHSQPTLRTRTGYR